MTKDNSQHNGLTGYRLHTKRLGHTGNAGIRTFKLPIHAEDNSRHDSFFADIKNDHEKQLGATNITSWLESREGDADMYSLLDFWLDSLRAGVVFAPKSRALNKLLADIAGSSIDEQVKASMREKQPAFVQAVNFADFKEKFALKGAIRSTSTKDSVRRRFLQCFDEDEDDLDPAVIATIDDLIETFFTSNGDTIERDKQNQYWRDQWGLDKSLYDLDGDKDLTFYPLPKLEMTPDAGAHDCLRKYRNWIDDNQDTFGLDDQEAKEAFLRLCWGNLQASGNYNAFSNYFNQIVNTLQSEDGIDDVVDDLCTASDVWSGQENHLRERIAFLADGARRLGQPKCVADWSKYRSTLGGRLASWLSNTIRQEEFLAETTQKQVEELTDIATRLDNEFYAEAFSAADDTRDRQLASEVETAQDTLRKLRDNEGFDPDALSVYRDSIGHLRSLLNRAHQILGDDTVDAYEAYPALHEQVRLVPKFVGGAKEARFSKYRNSLHMLKRGVTFLQEEAPDAPDAAGVRNSDEEFESYFLRQLNALQRFYQDANSQRFRDIVSDLFARFDIDISAVSSAKTFYISPYSNRDNRQVINVDTDNKDVSKLLARWANEIKPYWDDILATENWEEIMDAVKIDRIRYGWIGRLSADTTIHIADDLSDHFPEAETYRDLHGDTLSGTQADNFLQRVILSEMEGRVNEASREEFTVRYVVQPQDAGKKSNYPLVVSSNGGDKITAGTRMQWYIKDNDTSFAHSETNRSVWTLSDSKTFANGLEKKYVKPQTNLFAIKTSKYQLQFLDNALPGGAKRFRDDGGFDLELQDHSFIAEETLSVNWNFDTGNLHLESTDKNMYAAIPIAIIPENEDSDRDNRTRYLGIDVGEYGLAYTIIETEPEVSILETGFEHEPTLRNIRKQVTNIKNKQRTGTFGVPSTKLARLRKQAVTKLRNRMHDLAVRFDAILVYEWQISNFETGSARVTNVYNSVKRADTSSGMGSDAESGEAELVWGDSSWRVGREVSAFATSNMCSNCFESVYAYPDEAFSLQSVESEYAYYTVDGTQENVMAFLPDTDPEGISGGKLKQAIKDFSRPSIDTLVERQTNDFDLSKGKTTELIRHRGNSALFECPFCHAVNDADIQASLFIGLRAILKDRTGEDEEITIPGLLTFAESADV